jgi:ABC-type proline/glycine betaine transport system ATPase subunit
MFMGNGKIIESGPPKEIIENPRHEDVRQFFKRINELYRREGQ